MALGLPQLLCNLPSVYSGLHCHPLPAHDDYLEFRVTHYLEHHCFQEDRVGILPAAAATTAATCFLQGKPPSCSVCEDVFHEGCTEVDVDLHFQVGQMQI